MPDDDERTESLHKTLRSNGVGVPGRWNIYDTSRFESGDWKPLPGVRRIPRSVWVCGAVVLVLIVGITLIAYAVDAVTGATK